MIPGVVNIGREVIIPLKLRGANGMEVEIEASVDTGFSEYITLPQSWITALAPPYASDDIMTLADGSSIIVAMYYCIVIRDGRDIPVRAHHAEGTSLVGMSMMDNYKLVLDAKIGGTLTLIYNP